MVFDVGETLVDETRAWSERAYAAGVTPFALIGTLGAVIEQGREHHAVWEWLGVPKPPGSPTIDADDLYPDALPCLRRLRAAGVVVGIAGNQPAGAVEQLRALGFEADFVASSHGWGVEKPDRAFFDRVVQEAGVAPGEVLYVGDRLDNDVLPAARAGMRTAFLRRGPWGYVHARRPEAAAADLRLDDLDSLDAAALAASADSTGTVNGR